MTWYLRKSDGTVYGPADLNTLQRWASDGRVLPDDAVSPDGQQWQPAPELAALGMDWAIELADGSRFGPFHVLVLAELVRDHAANGDEQVIHRITHHVRRLGDVLLPAVVEHCALLQEALAALPPAAAPAEDAALAEGKAQYEAERTARVTSENELNARLREQSEREMDLFRRLEAAEVRVRQLEQEAASAPHSVKVADGDMDAQTLLRSYNDLSRNYERLLEQVRSTQEDLKTAHNARAQTEKEAAGRVNQLEEMAARERQEAEQLRQRLVEMEKSHMEIVRAYRDLNDRYIRLRQQGEGAPTAPPAAAPPKASGSEKPRVRLV